MTQREKNEMIRELQKIATAATRVVEAFNAIGPDLDPQAQANLTEELLGLEEAVDTYVQAYGEDEVRPGLTMHTLTTLHGTACPETALCGEHVHDDAGRRKAVDNGIASGDVVFGAGAFVEATGNPELACIVCGART